MAHQFTSFPPPACVSTRSSFSEAEIYRCRPGYVRPTSATTNLSTCTRARGSRPTWGTGVETGPRWIEGHDVSRRRRPLPPDHMKRARVFAGVASCDRASGTPVARPSVHATLAGRS